MQELLLKIGLPVLVSLLAVLWIYFRILKIAKAKNLVDNPEDRKLQKMPVPVLGGIAVFFGVLCAVLTAATLMDCSPLLPIMVGMVVMLYTGAMDDVLGLSPWARLLIETLVVLGLIYGSGCCIDSLHGLWGVSGFSRYLAVPLTVFACVGVVNAMNMIDGVNGLSCSLCIACSCLFGVWFVCTNDWPNAMLAFAMTGGLLPFLLHNVFGNTSRMFIGDAGTMVMGILMSWFMISVLDGENVASQTGSRFALVPMSLAILSVPVFDALRVMCLRMLHGGSPFKADKTHLHHMLIRVGFSHPVTALIELILNLLVVAVWVTCCLLGCSAEGQLYVVMVAAVLLVWGPFFALSLIDKKDSQLSRHLHRLSYKSHCGEQNWWRQLEKWLDAPEVKHLSEEQRKMHYQRKTSKFVNKETPK